MTFAADTLKLELNEHSDIEHVVGEGNGQAEVTSAGANTTITTDRLQLDFDAATGESILRQALANGKAELNSRPKAGTPQITARRLRSEAIVARMKPGGEDLEQVETHAPGTLELLPLAAGQRARRLDATRMWMQYGPRSVMESFRAVEVQTRTEPLRRGDPSVTTVSHDMTASFDANGTIRAMEQWDKFRYDEGPKHATADRAALDQAASRMTLTGNARTWDAAGQVIADSIALQQSNGDMTAQGNVHSTRVPERKAKAAPDANTLLASDEPLNGQSDKLSISGGNAVIIHEGRAVVWQSANKIQADRVAIDRKSGTLTAEGNVVSFLADRAVPGKASVMTAVRSKRLDYDDPTRLARYSGDTRMTRPGLDVRSAELRAWLSAGESATLDRLFADQNVTILQSVSGRTRQGKGEHAEYYLKEEKVILSGGNPVLTDSVKGASRGEKLTYWADKDNLLVDGAPAGPAVSRIRRD
jgi:lipopolysaccharide export system protein LptA